MRFYTFVAYFQYYCTVHHDGEYKLLVYCEEKMILIICQNFKWWQLSPPLKCLSPTDPMQALFSTLPSNCLFNMKCIQIFTGFAFCNSSAVHHGPSMHWSNSPIINFNIEKLFTIQSIPDKTHIWILFLKNMSLYGNKMLQTVWHWLKSFQSLTETCVLALLYCKFNVKNMDLLIWN